MDCSSQAAASVTSARSKSAEASDARDHEVRPRRVRSGRDARRILGEELCGAIACIDGGASIFGKAGRIRRTLRKLDVRAHCAISVGDQLTDAEAAASAGVNFAAVSWGYASIVSLVNAYPDAVLDRVEDIRGLAPRPFGPPRTVAGASLQYNAATIKTLRPDDHQSQACLQPTAPNA